MRAPLLPGDAGPPQKVRKPIGSFDFHDDGIIFYQAASNKLLFAQLPPYESACSGVFLFGMHAGEQHGMQSGACMGGLGAAGLSHDWAHDPAQGDMYCKHALPATRARLIASMCEQYAR